MNMTLVYFAIGIYLLSVVVCLVSATLSNITDYRRYQAITLGSLVKDTFVSLCPVLNTARAFAALGENLWDLVLFKREGR